MFSTDGSECKVTDTEKTTFSYWIGFSYNWIATIAVANRKSVASTECWDTEWSVGFDSNSSNYFSSNSYLILLQ